ncbi:non-canonical purine NTP pyrophosphatase [Staphylococcus gallinarum]|uniref:non-canonical purine NTP pyrophosphatase n=1 Tax=Staphylococcus gallinarum TaxID=1293 RepID=UPI002174E442|nr:non-canonical purine NTP pyrophosphatase [Staphylococcus gallinarum]
MRKICEHCFDYVSFFYLDDINNTMSQLSAEDKCEVRHRGKAIEKLRQSLEGDVS